MLPMTVYFKAHFMQGFQRFPLRRKRRIEEIGVKIELPRGRDRWIEHPQRSRGCVSWICKSRQVSKFALRVQFLKGFFVEHHLAAYLKCSRRAQWNRFDGPGIFGDIFANCAVAP